MVIRDRVYDLTDFLREVCEEKIFKEEKIIKHFLRFQHPAGPDIMLEYAGTDATMAFADKPHSLDAWLMLEKYLVGELIPEERMFDDGYSS
jgi:cytochrome b involved in lipid metabolism